MSQRNLTGILVPKVQSVDTIADLRAMETANLKNHTPVEVLGYHQANDGGGGLFYWDSAFAESDNGGTVIQPSGNRPGRFRRVHSEKINVRWFGAKGVSSADDTSAMQRAHDLGLVVYYPKGRYMFSSKIEIKTGGIVGDGRYSILDSTDASSEDLIVYSGGDNTNLLVNTLGGVFRDFHLRVGHPAQKTCGAGIRIDPGSTNENYLTAIENVTVRNVPVSVYLANISFITIRGCYFAFYSKCGVYQDNKDFEDNGDNAIVDNWFFKNMYYAPNDPEKAISIKYRGGGARILGNKINGGAIGIDISPLRPTSNALIANNSIENQEQACIRYITEEDAVPAENANTGKLELFAEVLISGNQLNGTSLNHELGDVAAILIDPGKATLTELVVANNIIRHRAAGRSAIDIRNTDIFAISANLLDGYGAGQGSKGIFIHSDASNGNITGNTIQRFSHEIVNNGINVQVIGETAGISSMYGSIVVQADTAHGPLYIGHKDVLFDTAFKSPPKVFAQVFDSGANGGVSVTVSNITVNGFRLHLVSYALGGTSQCDWKAEGYL